MIDHIRFGSFKTECRAHDENSQCSGGNALPVFAGLFVAFTASLTEKTLRVPGICSPAFIQRFIPRVDAKQKVLIIHDYLRPLHKHSGCSLCDTNEGRSSVSLEVSTLLLRRIKRHTLCNLWHTFCNILSGLSVLLDLD